MNRPSAETIVPAAVDRLLLEATERLANAEASATDRTVRDAIRRARKELAPAVARARLIVQDARLRGATQRELLPKEKE